MTPRLLPLALAILLLAGCGLQPPGGDPAPPPQPPPSALQSPGPEPPPAEADVAIRLAFVGDILLGDSLAGLLAQKGADYPWEQAAPILREADLAIGNLETAVSTRGQPEPDKQFTFRSHPSTLDGARRAGIDILSLANNHSLDYGPEALLDTIRHLEEAKIHPVGAGADLVAATKPVYVEVQGLRLAFLAFSRVIPAVHWVAWEEHPGTAPGWDPKVVLEAVARAREDADHVILLLHWGEERKDEPRPADVDLARQLRESGATLVVGHHPHVLQRIDWREGQLVAYSLGNFIFPTVPRRLNQETGILEVTLDRSGVTEARLTPFQIEPGQPRLAREDEARRILERLDQLSKVCGTRVGSDGTISPAAAAPPDC